MKSDKLKVRSEIMTEEEREAYYDRIKSYPNCEPCVECIYWKDISSSGLYVKHKSNTSNTSLLPACHYHIKHGYARGGITTDGYCSAFRSRKKGGK